jgi:hypothetical protein
MPRRAEYLQPRQILDIQRHQILISRRLANARRWQRGKKSPATPRASTNRDAEKNAWSLQRYRKSCPKSLSRWFATTRGNQIPTVAHGSLHHAGGHP